jgi:DNA polymerase-3 subunit delta'
VSSQPAALLPTVLSRCQQVTFQLAGSAAVEAHLQSLGLAPAEAASLAALSGGRVGWAVSAARRPEVLEIRRSLLDLCASLPGTALPRGLRLAEEIREQALRLSLSKVESEEDEEGDEGPAPAEAGRDRALRAALPWCLEVMALWFRDCLAAAHGGTLVNPDYAEAIWAIRPDAAHETALEALLAARQQIQRNANLDLALETLAIGLLSRASAAPRQGLG